jgi:hypothetical protein
LAGSSRRPQTMLIAIRNCRTPVSNIAHPFRHRCTGRRRPFLVIKDGAGPADPG